MYTYVTIIAIITSTKIQEIVYKAMFFFTIISIINDYTYYGLWIYW
jgi:hypothetical protein